jgi:hypothetical protein
VQVFELAAKRQQKRWLEKGQRETAWFSLRDAAKLIQEPALHQSDVWHVGKAGAARRQFVVIGSTTTAR